MLYKSKLFKIRISRNNYEIIISIIIININKTNIKTMFEKNMPITWKQIICR